MSSTDATLSKIFDHMSPIQIVSYVCTCVCFIVLGSIGSALLIVGIVFFSLSDTRQELIDKFNDDVDNWTNHYIVDMKALVENGSTITNNYGILKPSNVNEINMKLRSVHDHPAIKKWEEFYFAIFNMFEHVQYSSKPQTNYVQFETPIQGLTAGYKFFTTQSEHVSSTGSHSSSTHHSDTYRSARSRCLEMGGTYRSSWGIGNNCYYYYIIERVCVIIDPKTLSFVPMSSNADQDGCNRQQQFKVRKGEQYDPSFFQKTQHQDYYNLDVKYEVRSVNDPEVKLSLYTNGKNDFGMTFYTKRTTAIVCTVFGGLIGLLCLSCPYIVYTLVLCLVVLKTKDDHHGFPEHLQVVMDFVFDDIIKCFTCSLFINVWQRRKTTDLFD